MRLEVDAVLLDIDGTLVDSTPVVNRTWTAWAADWGVDAAEVLRVCHGRRTEDTVAEFLPAEQRAAATAEVTRRELADLDDVTALPGARTLLAALPAARWAAVTSGPRTLMTARLGAALLPVPDVLITAEDVRAGKPDPEGYLAAAAALGVPVTRCAVVEDAPAGIAAGRAAGAVTIAIGTSHPAGELTAADAVLPDLTALRVSASPGGLVLITP